MANPTKRIEKIIEDVGMQITINALQQVCFYRAYELARASNADAEQYYDVGMSLGEAVEIVNID